MKAKLVTKLTNKGFPTHDKGYRSAHAKANRAEKKAFPKGYEKLKRKESALGEHELMGKNSRDGKIKVERKFKRYKKEIALHERIEHAALKKKRTR